MNILCFASTATMLEKISKAVIHLNAPGLSIELYKSLDAVQQRLCQPRKCNCIAILCLKNKKEIGEVTALQENFNGTKLILVLPKRDPEAIKTAHKIFPRFIAFADEDFTPITMILKKMNGSLAQPAAGAGAQIQKNILSTQEEGLMM